MTTYRQRKALYRVRQVVEALVIVGLLALAIFS